LVSRFSEEIRPNFYFEDLPYSELNVIKVKDDKKAA
jgi:hypothetical protein